MARTGWVAAGLLALAAAGLAAQQRDSDFGLGEQAWCREARDARECAVREEVLTGLTLVDLDARGNGGVEVRGWDRPDVQVRVRIAVYDGDDPAAIASQVRLVTTGGRIRVDGPPNGRTWRSRGWSAAFELQMPRGMELRVDATNGGVGVRDVSGRMDLRTVNGGISLDGASGDVRGETVNGGVQARLASGTWRGPLDLSTVNGGITLAMTPDLSADIDVRAVNGGVRIDYPVTVSGLISNRREFRGTIGAGGGQIRATAVNGGVTIRRVG